MPVPPRPVEPSPAPQASASFLPPVFPGPRSAGSRPWSPASGDSMLGHRRFQTETELTPTPTRQPQPHLQQSRSHNLLQNQFNSRFVTPGTCVPRSLSSIIWYGQGGDLFDWECNRRPGGK